MKNRNKLKYLAVCLFGLPAMFSSALELQIKASAINEKTLVVASFENAPKLKENISSLLGMYNNLNIDYSSKKCDDVSINLNTSYYCIDLKNQNNVIDASLQEKFGSKLHKKVNFFQSNVKQDDIKTARDLSSSIYKTIYNKETVLNSKLAYVQRKDLMDGGKIFNLKITDFDGTNAKTLLASPQPILSIDWSPDNSKLAYVSYEKVRSSVFIHDLQTGSRKRITTFKGINAFPSWSPDGNQIALSLSKDGTSDIYIFDLRKNKLQKITSFKYDATEPVWISSNELAFTTDKDGNPSIYALNLKTKRIYPLSKNYLYSTSAKASNDMKKLYSIFSKSGNSGILEIDKSNRNERVLVKDFFAESPSVGKGDETIIYSTKKGDKSILKAVDLKGRNLYEIESIGTSLKEPSYSN